MRPTDNDSKMRKGRKSRKGAQHFSLTNQEIMADLMYPAPVRAPSARKGGR